MYGLGGRVYAELEAYGLLTQTPGLTFISKIGSLRPLYSELPLLLLSSSHHLPLLIIIVKL